MRLLRVSNSFDVVVTLNAKAAICLPKHVVYLAFGQRRSGAPLALCGLHSLNQPAHIAWESLGAGCTHQRFKVCVIHRSSSPATRA
jgi:hypothetical protein